MPKIQFLSKRIYKESDKSITVLTSGYGGKFIVLPKSQITARKEIKHKTNKTLDLVELSLSDWMFNIKQKELKEITELKIL